MAMLRVLLLLTTFFSAFDYEMQYFKVLKGNASSCDGFQVEPSSQYTSLFVIRDCHPNSRYCFFNISGVDQPGNLTACVKAHRQDRCVLHPVEWLHESCPESPTTSAPNTGTSTMISASDASSTPSTTTRSTSETTSETTSSTTDTSSTHNSDMPLGSDIILAANSTTKEGNNKKNLAYIVIIIPFIFTILLIILCCCCQRHHKKKEDDRLGGQVERLEEGPEYEARATKEKKVAGGDKECKNDEGTECDKSGEDRQLSPKEAELRHRKINTERNVSAVEDTSEPHLNHHEGRSKQFWSNQGRKTGACDDPEHGETTMTGLTECQEENRPASYVMITATGQDLKYVIQPDLMAKRTYFTASCDAASVAERYDEQQCTEDGIENPFRAASSSYVLEDRSICDNEVETIMDCPPLTISSDMPQPFTSLAHPEHAEHKTPSVCFRGVHKQPCHKELEISQPDISQSPQEKFNNKHLTDTVISVNKNQGKDWLLGMVLHYFLGLYLLLTNSFFMAVCWILNIYIFFIHFLLPLVERGRVSLNIPITLYRQQ